MPKKYEGLDGTELAISESQERMALVIAPENIKKFIAFADEENLEATVIGQVSDNRRLVMYWRGGPFPRLFEYQRRCPACRR